MTMNPHTSASALRGETAVARATRSNADGRAAAIKRALSPAALASAGFILAVTLIARVFYK